MDFQSMIREAASQGAVLLRNEGGMLPFTPADKVAVFGRCQIDYYKSGTGSGGSIHVSFSVNLADGFETLRRENFPMPEIDGAVLGAYREWLSSHPFDNGDGGWASEPWHQEEMPVSDGMARDAASRSTKAVFVVGRTAGEDKDNKPEPGSYYLTETERSSIASLCRAFPAVAVVMNVSNVIDTSWIDDDEFLGKIKAVLYSWQGGMQGGQACADILCGKATPSGRLTDTIAYSLDDYPSTRNFGSGDDEIYAEDIFVGYRHFVTFAPEKVMFPFGFGLSYTTFSQEVRGSSCRGGEISVTVEVRNTGNVRGADVVQVYAECPQGLLGKSAKSLCAFAKTKELGPGERETVEISFPMRSIASYDDSGVSGFPHSFVLERGTYRFFLGTDCLHLTPISLAFKVPGTTAVELLSEACAPEIPFRRVRPGASSDGGTFELSFEDVPVRTTDIARRISAGIPEELSRAGKSIAFGDVVSGKATAEELVAEFSDEELLTIVRGEGMMSRKVTPGIASAFGGISESLHSRGIPAVGCADGPSGIRMDNDEEATLIPIGTLLACTWNVPLVEELYGFVGGEMKEKGVDVLLGPGCNIHRSPLNGRNFEYFSEDPLVSGKMAAAVCRGLSRSGALATVKHFALNNQESHRRTENSVVSERALREIYLRPFEIAVKEGNARAVMSAYNSVNGRKAASNYELCTSILKKEWGFAGIVMTDWWAAMNDCVSGGVATGRLLSQMIRAGNDVYMVVPNDSADRGGFGDDMEKSMAEGTLTRAEIQRCASAIIRFVSWTNAAKKPLRPLRDEIVVEDALDSAPEGARTFSLGEVAEGDALLGDMYFVAPEDARYDFSGEYVKDGKDTLSQSVSNVFINGRPCGSFECRSTGGIVVNALAAQVAMKKGVYKVRLVHTKPGITVMSLTMNADKFSPITMGLFE